jgi:hypothetical protein
VGWPESKVFWANKSGPSVGMASLVEVVSQQTLGTN